MKKSKLLGMLALVLGMGFPLSATANTCSDAGLSTLMKFDFNSAFPLRVMGQTVIRGGDVPHPPGATKKAICKCGKEPFAIYGYTRGMWLPTRFVEVVRESTCSPVYGKAVKPMLQKMAAVNGIAAKAAKAGTNFLGGGEGMGMNETGFRHYHSWVFPFSGMYGWTPRCFAKGGELETSLTQPAWSGSDPVFSNLLYPEWMALGTMTSLPLFDVASHTASCAANTTGIGWGKADDSAYWLGGCMGMNLPAVGAMSSEKNNIVGTSTILNRSIMVSNRTGGFASVKTVGDDALCSPVPTPFPAKSEFKSAMLFPYPEKGSGAGSDNSVKGAITAQLTGAVANFFNIGSKGAHRLGASDFAWAKGRNDQALNGNDTDTVYLLWRWVDCCEFN